MKLITVVSVLTKPDEYFYQFLISLAKYKHKPLLIGLGEQYAGGNFKLKKIKQLAKKLEGHTAYMLYTDCWDSIFVEEPEECALKFESMSVNALISGTSVCHPLPELSTFFPDKGKNKYINTGGIIAKPSEMIKLLDFLDVDGHSDGIDDQAILSRAYVKDSDIFKIDSDCQIFQTLYNANSDLEFHLGKGYYNTVTNTYPSIIHGDGGTRLEEVIANVHLLETSPLVEMY